MSASITLAGERLIAQYQAEQKVLKVSRFVLAMVPDLDPLAPVDRAAGKPAPEQIVGAYSVTQAGYVNPSQVVYSLMLDSSIGDFDWNWIGLETDSDVLFSVAYVPVQQKRKNIPPVQIGNNVTRNFLVAFDGAHELTGVTIDASTWQHDFTVRLTGIDQRERLSNRDVYGRAAFFDKAFQLRSTAEGFELLPGVAYVEGLRLALDVEQAIAPLTLPALVGLDVCLRREGSDRVARWAITYDEQADYVDSVGNPHFCVPLAEIKSAGEIVDARAVEPIQSALVRHFAARDGDYPDLRARSTTKADVGLSDIPNAISDDPETNSSEIIASTAALNRLNQQIGDALVGMVAAFDMGTAPPGWLKRNGADVSRTAYAKLFAVLGTRYGAGDGVTSFNIGDSRGVFIRGLSDGNGIDPDRLLGSLQDSQNAAHIHSATAAVGGLHTHAVWGVTDNNGLHGHTVSGWAENAGQHYHYDAGSGWVRNGGNDTGGSGVGTGNTETNSAGAHTHEVNAIAASAGEHAHGFSGTSDRIGEHGHVITIDSAGGAEARPINQALLICIKY